MKLFPTCFTLALVSSVVDAGLINKATSYPGTCPNIPGSQTFNLKEYTSSTWFNNAASPFFWNFPFSSCQTATYKLNKGDQKGYISIYNSQIMAKGEWSRYTAKGKALPVEGENGKLTVAFNGKLPEEVADERESENNLQGNYIVLDTDNQNYSYVFSCSNNSDKNNIFNSLFSMFGGNKNQDKHDATLWILTKDADLSKDDVKEHWDNAIDMLKNDFGWEHAEEFREEIEYLEVAGCEDPVELGEF